MLSSGGNEDSGPLKSVILLQKKIKFGKETKDITDSESTKGDNNT